MLTITGLHHVSVPAADVVRSSDWYERVLGFAPRPPRWALDIAGPDGLRIALHTHEELSADG